MTETVNPSVQQILSGADNPLMPGNQPSPAPDSNTGTNTDILGGMSLADKLRPALIAGGMGDLLAKPDTTATTTPPAVPNILQHAAALAQADPKAAAQPGAWKSLIVSGAISALGGAPPAAPVDQQQPPAPKHRGVGVVNALAGSLGDIGAATQGGTAGGGIAGAARVLAARNQRLTQEDKDRAQIATANAQMYHEQALTHKLGAEAMDDSSKSGQTAVDTILHAPSPGRVVTEGKTANELSGMIKSAQNPDGTLQPDRQLVYNTGKKQMGTNPDGTPHFVPTFTVVDPGGPVKLSEDDLKDFQKLGYKEGEVPTEMSPANYNSMRQQLDNVRAYTTANNQAAEKAGLADYRMRITKEATSFAGDGTVNAAYAKANGDPIDALKILQTDQQPQFDQFRKAHPDLQNDFIAHLGAGNFDEGQKAYDKFVEQHEKNEGKLLKVQDDLDKLQHEVDEASGDKAGSIVGTLKAKIEDPNTPTAALPKLRSMLTQAQGAVDASLRYEQDKEKNKKDADLSFTGNQDLTGDPKAFMASLKPNEQAIVREMGNGQMPLTRMEYLAAKNPNLLEAVALTYPGFDGGKIKAYVDANHDYTSTKNGTAGGSLNAGATALQHLQQLKKINDDSPTEVRIPGTAANKAYNNLLDTVADELVTFYQEPKTNETIASKKSTLGGLLNRDAAITEQAKAMGVKFDSFQQSWDNAAPSDAYRRPMPNVSTTAMQARASLDPDYAKAHPELLKSGQQGASNVPKGALTPNKPGKAADQRTLVWQMQDGSIQDANGRKYNPQTGQPQ